MRTDSPTRVAGREPVQIAVDISLLSGSAGGLSRYLRALLPKMVALAGNRVHWQLYARDRAAAGNLLHSLSVTLHRDGLPPDLGRVLSLFVSMPLWSRRDRPQVFWGPAHRLPVGLPAGTASVVTVHDLAWLRAPATMRVATRLLDRHLMGRAVRRSRSVICVSRASSIDLLEHFPEAQGRVHVIHAAAERLPPPNRQEVVPGLLREPFFLFVGTLEPRKNLPRLLRAYASACQGAIGMPRLAVVGATGWGRTRLAEEVEHLGLSGRVVLLGRASDAALAALYAEATALLMPSLYEGFGLPIVEALSHGLPVLTSDRAAMPEVAGEAGLLVDPESEDEIAAALRRLAGDAPLRRALGARALEQAALFSWDQAAEQTLRVLLDAAEYLPVPSAAHSPPGADTRREIAPRSQTRVGTVGQSPWASL